jgi:hypothetical protein
MTILAGADNLLGSFSRYIRVVRPRIRARLGINGGIFRQGEVVATRVENSGTSTLTYGDPFRVERVDGVEWSVVPAWHGGVFRGDAPVGWSGFCSAGFLILPEYEPGHYRVVKQVWARGHGTGRRAFDLVATFDVVG